MKPSLPAALAGSSLLLMASAANVQAQSSAGTPAASDDSKWSLEEVIVTARRRSESLQDVPQTVNAVTSESIEKLNILRFEDVQALVPGLSLSSGNTGYSTTASLRGVSFVIETRAAPTVAFYMNDAPVESNFLFQSMFDVGQIEVLRGPQGTVRGIAAPSGAITVATHKADLQEIGGYVGLTGTDRETYDAQGAFNLPLISDVLAIRVAGQAIDSQYDHIRSVNNPADPHSYSKAARTTISFQPTDSFSADLVYQYQTKDVRSFLQEYGNGHPAGETVPGLLPGTTLATPPGGYNGPRLVASDRLGVSEGSLNNSQRIDVVTGQADWRFAGQKLSYVGSWKNNHLDATYPQDSTNSILGYEQYQVLLNKQRALSQELRLSSEERLWGFFDYTAGVFYQSTWTTSRVNNGPTYFNGAFGSPLAPAISATPNLRFTAPITIAGDGRDTELSEFASVTFHVGAQTEITAGGRYITREAHNDESKLALGGGGFTALPPALLGLPSCAAGRFASTYPGTCDVPVAASVIQDTFDNRRDTPFIYNFSASHRFTDDFLLYANTGSSWRPGPQTLGVTNGRNDPTLNKFILLDPEKSRSYEVGFKASAFDKRLRLDVATYFQKFDNLIMYMNPTRYLSDNGSSRPSVGTANFTANANAKVQGIDVDSSFLLTPRWNLGLAFSYSDGKVDNDQIPCNDSNFDGIPDAGIPTVASFQAAGKIVALCQSNASVSRLPLWSGTLQSEYSVPFAASMDGFVRGLLTYYPENKRRSENFVVDSYGLLNFYTGVRAPDGAWEVALFGKNITNTQTTLSQDPQPSAGTYFGTSGYAGTSYTPLREFGVNVRYSFGSR